MRAMRFFRRFWWAVPPVIVLSMGFWWSSGDLPVRWAILIGAPALADFAEHHDLGDRLPNETVAARLILRNRGGQDLIVSQIKTSCACLSWKVETEGPPETVDEVRVAPGHHVVLVVTLAIQTDSPGHYQQPVAFQTNDPLQPDGRITITYRTASGGVKFVPGTVAFGQLVVGQIVSESVQVVDQSLVTQSVTRVTCSDPDLLIVRWQPTPGTPRVENGVELGRIDVIPRTDRPVLLDQSVRIEFDNPLVQPRILPIRGHVARRIEVTPESLHLPLSASDGPVYTTKCLIRGNGQSLRLTVDSMSPGLSAKVLSEADSPIGIVQITWMPGIEQRVSRVLKSVRIRIEYENRVETVEIPVTCEAD